MKVLENSMDGQKTMNRQVNNWSAKAPNVLRLSDQAQMQNKIK